MALLRASSRKEVGTRQVRRLRDHGLVPAIIYGHQQTPQAITLSEHDLEQAVTHGERLLEVDVEGQAQHVLVKDVQWDTFGKAILHADLFRVSLDERVEVTVSLVLRGTPVGLADGGVLNQSISSVRIECLVAAIPEELRVVVAAMKIGDLIHLRDVELPAGVKLMGDPEMVVCSCSMVAEEVVPEAPEGAVAEPEVIGAKKEEEEGEAEAAEKK
jgi:large subunit ribosomal protein L25